jgi:GTP-binding protein
VDPKLTTLADFRSGAIFSAGDGSAGGSSNKTGRGGRDLTLRVPPGTLVTDRESGRLLLDLRRPGRREKVAEGGRGGRGNASFATSRRRAPRRRTRGGEGEERRLRLDLKLMADVGLVGFPNAGKSTFLSRVTGARPRTADYPFTTLRPLLGVVAMDRGFSFVIADLPGLIEGASRGRGLGHRFLRHAERNRVILFLLAPDLEVPPARQLEVLRGEAAEHGIDLSRTRTMVALAKRDLLDEDSLRRELETLPGDTACFSSATGEGLREFLALLAKRVVEARGRD